MKRLLITHKRFWACVALVLLAGGVIVWILTPPDISATVPSWRGITPGQTTKAEVANVLGQPMRNVDPQRYVYQETLMSPYRITLTHEIQFRDDKVWRIVEDIPYQIFTVETRPRLRDLVAQYGLAEKITWHRYSATTRMALFCRHGLMVEALSDIAWIPRKYYFVPMTTTRCIQAFREIAIQDPFPKHDDIIPENPWPLQTSPRAWLGLD